MLRLIFVLNHRRYVMIFIVLNFKKNAMIALLSTGNFFRLPATDMSHF